MDYLFATAFQGTPLAQSVLGTTGSIRLAQQDSAATTVLCAPVSFNAVIELLFINCEMLFANCSKKKAVSLILA